METLFTVPDMMCSHCAMRVEKAVKKLPGVTDVVVDPNAKTVKVQGDVDTAAVLQAIATAGYQADFKCKE